MNVVVSFIILVHGSAKRGCIRKSLTIGKMTSREDKMKYLLRLLGAILLVVWWSFTTLAYDVILHDYLMLPLSFMTFR